MEAIEQIKLLCNDIEYEIAISGSHVSEGLKARTLKLFTFIELAPFEIRKAVENNLSYILKKSQLYAKVWLYSAMLTLTYDTELMKDFLTYIVKEEGFTLNVKYFLYYQIKAAIFNHVSMENYDTKLLKWKLLAQVVDGFKKELGDVLMPVPYECRNQDKVFVVTEQILGEMHAPTKIAFDRCKILIEKMNKQVLLINSAEVLSSIGTIPYFGAKYGNYHNQLLEKEFLEWKGTKILYFQCENNMPNLDALHMLLQMIQNEKPALVVSIGGSSILSNLIDNILPVLTVGLSPSDLEMTMTTCQTLSRKLTLEDLELMKQVGKNSGSVIESIFTSSLQPQAKTVTRKELSLPEKKFLLVVVGYRLDVDIDEAFMNMLVNAMDDDIEVAMIGIFESCGMYMDKMPKLKGKVHCLGLTDDILAWIDTCDLYVNPYRKGGGTSGVEALYQGIPVVTFPYGDVAVNVGEDFWTESYDTMVELIQKYKNDSEFYHRMTVIAKERSDILLDTEGEFCRIIEEFEKRTRG